MNAAASGPIQVVKKVQDQAESDGKAAVALIQAAQVTQPPEPDPSGAGRRISLRV